MVIEQKKQKGIQKLLIKKEASLPNNKDTVKQSELGKGNLLSNTATMTYNLIIAGLLLFNIGIMAFYTNNRRKA